MTTASTFSFPDLNWILHPAATAFLAICTVSYFLGFRSQRSSNEELGHRQSAAFVLGAILIAVATISPLNAVSQDFLFARALQQILVGILAPPLLWYSQAVLCIAAPFQGLWRQLGRSPNAWAAKYKPTLISLTGPGVIWALTLCIFVVWHDPKVISWLNAAHWRANAGLWIYFSSFFLFWWHAMAKSPYWHKPLPIWMRFLYLIVGGEVANMLVGVSLAFRPYVVYEYYASRSVHGIPSPLQDQMISGAIIWVTGSFVYILVAVALLGQNLFHRPPPNRVPPLDWQSATHRTIAPGLEDRVRQ